MKRFMKVLSVILCFVILFGSAPLAGFVGIELLSTIDFWGIKAKAATSGTCGENLTWSYDENTRALKISGSGPMTDFKSNDGAPWHSYYNYVKSIELGDKVTTIGNYAFYCFYALKSITIPDNITSIGSYSFYACKYLESVNLGNGVRKIGKMAFNACFGLKNITIPNSLEYIENEAFSGCSALIEFKVNPDNQYFSNDSYGVLFSKDKTQLIQYPSGNKRTSYEVPTGVVTICDDAFSNCDNLVSVVISEGVLSIGWSAFSNCENLTNITIPVSLKSIGYIAFIYSRKLTNVYYSGDISDWLKISFYQGYKNESNPMRQAYNFYSKGNLVTNLLIPEGITYIDSYAFYNWDCINTVILPESLTTIGSSAFQYCNNLKTLFFCGNETLYNSINIGSNNQPIHNASKHYSVVAENIIFSFGLPTLSDTDAKNFLKFLYNGNLDDEEIINGLQYKLITGNICNEKYSSHEIKNLIKTFVIIVQTMVNKNIKDSSNRSEYLSEQLVNHLKNELDFAYLESDVVVEAYKSNLYDTLVNGIKKMFDGNLEEASKLYIDYLTLEKYVQENLINDTVDELISSVSHDIKSYINKVFIAFNATGLTLDQEYENRYKYFNAYINNRDISNNEYFNSIMDATFIQLADQTFLSVLNKILTGKDSWVEHRSDLNRWAEYVYQLTQYVYANPHSFKSTIVEPSCTAQGYNRHECEYCGYIRYDNWIEATGHDYKKTTINPTCLDDGYDLYECKKCSFSFQTNTVSQTGHINYEVTSVAPTCTTNGYDLYSCVCGTRWTDNSTNALGHSYVCTVIEPTEIEQGYTLNECSTCGYKYFCDYINPLEHEYSVTIVEPTCVSEGYTIHTCDNCNNEYIDSYVSATGHNYFLVSEVLSTCTDEGIREYSCINCENIFNEPLSVKEHDYCYATEIVEPTCEEQGYSLHICRCGELYSDSYVSSLGHEHIIVETFDASCTEDGYIKYECLNCNNFYNETIPAPQSGHVFQVTETVNADCTHCGYVLTNCTLCGFEKYENIIVADGHNLTEWQVINNATSTNTGLKERTCYDCDFIETEIIPLDIIISITTPGNRTINYGESIKIYANVGSLPEGYKIKWKIEGTGVKIEPSVTGRICTVTSTSTGNVVIKAYVVDSNGNIVTDENGKQVSDSEYFYSEANLWLRIVYFFRKLFGISMTTVQLFKGII